MIDSHALLLSPAGRIGRRTFWTLIAGLTAANVLVSLVPFFGALAALVLLWPFSCVIAKRLHDTGRRGWPVAPVAALSAVAGVLACVIGAMSVEPTLAMSAFALAGLSLLVGGVATVAALGLILYAGLARGTAGTNRFGDPEGEPFSVAALLR